ncbi:glycosyltransferase family 2 protein [Helicobacter labacensis]|uniref:glycosyltransferase family 2 protein n=1 Tax=Helicobacter labacensis TaxID=2316079 RepID=UPI000EB346A5|nr:glycosyltransferase family 2 protein [Helicobacter labacensis]
MSLPFVRPHFNTISLVITTYNQEARLALVLDSILQLVFKPDEVLIADDGSTPKTRALLENYQSKFQAQALPLIHVWQEDLGFRAAKSRNNAITRARGDYIVIIDTDMILHPYFIYDHLYFARPKTLLQGGRVILNPVESQIMLDRHDHSLAMHKKSYKNYRQLALAKLFYLPSVRTCKTNVLLKGVRSANMSFSKADFLAIEGFNENFVGWGREDSEFVARFLFNGGVMKRLRFCALAYHIHHKENDRAYLEKNHALYLQTLQERKIAWR